LRIETIPVEKIYVSPLNIRAEEDFGKSLEDEVLRKNVAQAGIIQPITVRPDDKGGYEVIIGRRRFLAVKDRVKALTCIVRDEWDDREALKSSLIENMGVLRKDLDPIVRARALKRLVETSPRGLTGVAKELGIPKSTLSEFLKVLELSEKMQQKVSSGQVPFRYAIKVARLELPKEAQDYLAEVAETKGLDSFKKELVRLSEGRGKRGAPPGLLVIRLVFDPDSADERRYFEALKKYCESKGLEVGKYVKDVLIDHIRSLVTS